MTSVRLGLVSPRSNGVLRLLRGSLSLSPYRRVETVTEPSDAVLPVPFVVRLDGRTAPIVELDHNWIWVGKEVVPRGRTRVVLIPSPETGVVPDWSDLADVDPTELPPDDVPAIVMPLPSGWYEGAVLGIVNGHVAWTDPVAGEFSTFPFADYFTDGITTPEDSNG